MESIPHHWLLIASKVGIHTTHTHTHAHTQARIPTLPDKRNLIKIPGMYRFVAACTRFTIWTQDDDRNYTKFTCMCVCARVHVCVNLRFYMQFTPHSNFKSCI